MTLLGKTVDQFGVFSALVLMAHSLGVASGTTALAATVFFWTRVAHFIVLLTGVGVMMARTVLFTIAWLAVMVFAWALWQRVA